VATSCCRIDKRVRARPRLEYDEENTHAMQDIEGVDDGDDTDDDDGWGA
jgi:hypothetical protein